jgi:hypothetical protein
MIATQKFIIFYLSYIIVSLVISASIAFTGAAWIVYFFSLLPLYLICTLYCLNLYLNHRHQKVRLKLAAWYLIPISQLLFMLTSPADCYLWHQGRACYSFIQTHLDKTLLDPPHWAVAEVIFPVSLFLYCVLILAFTNKLKLESK